MRRILASLCLTILLSSAQSAERHYSDATLRAIQFVDKKEGWAVGDEGVIWHTIDGGKNWERQSTGVRASLRSLYFLNPFVGWVVGREELPLGKGSAGVLLLTTDGGVHWRRLAPRTMPGLNQIRFIDEKIGFAVGDATDQFPSGVFTTKDGGKSWKPLEGPRSASWSAIAMTSKDRGALVGAWNQMATVRGDNIKLAKVDQLGGRRLNGAYLTGEMTLRKEIATDGRGVAVGQGGLLLVTQDSGATWGYLAPRLPATVLSCWDFNAVDGAGSHVWVAGRPGSLILHSPDRGKTWEIQKTNAPLPLHGLHFQDSKKGWAVGELGTILTTEDGGKSWKVQHRGRRRSAVLVIQSEDDNTLGTIAHLGNEESYLTTVLRALSPDMSSSALNEVGVESRLAYAVRLIGGANSEMLWQFPVSTLANKNSIQDHQREWDRMHRRVGKATEQMIRQLTLAIRIWRPNVVLLSAEADASPTTKFVQDAAKKAFEKAADPKAYPEQIEKMGLSPWEATKLYVKAGKKEGNVNVTLSRPVATLGSTLQDFVTPSVSMIKRKSSSAPLNERFSLIATRLKSNEDRHLMQGIRLAYDGSARRPQPRLRLLKDDVKERIRAQTSLRNLVTASTKKGLGDPSRLLATIAPMLEKLPPEQGARSAHAIARHYVRLGEWHLAREAFAMMIEKFPAHPLSMDAYRWLIQHNGSSEVRRRHEMGQFLITQAIGFRNVGEKAKPEADLSTFTEEQKKVLKAIAQMQSITEKSTEHWIKQSTAKEIKDWSNSSLKLERKLAAYGPLIGTDPSIQFVVNSARRKLGQFREVDQWCSDYLRRQPSGPWHDAARMELWLTRQQGPSPKSLMLSPFVEKKPFLDGKLNDACWKKGKVLTLNDAVGTTADRAATKVMITHDKEFIYLAIRCEHPRGLQVPKVDKRARDANLDNYDRVSIFLDLDRDYSTAYHFQVDQRGCARESCWGDKRWNPTWFVAVHSEETYWQAEAAIPRVRLTGDHFMQGRPWCCNIIRAMPGKGAQAWSLPAGNPESNPRLEGMGVLMFMPKKNQKTASEQPRPAMRRIP